MIDLPSASASLVLHHATFPKRVVQCCLVHSTRQTNQTLMLDHFPSSPNNSCTYQTVNADGEEDLKRCMYLSSSKGSIHFSVLKIQPATSEYAEEQTDWQWPPENKVYWWYISWAFWLMGIASFCSQCSNMRYKHRNLLKTFKHRVVPEEQ